MKNLTYNGSFSKTVEQKYLKQLDAELIDAKYREFKAYFGNPDIFRRISETAKRSNIRVNSYAYYPEIVSGLFAL